MICATQTLHKSFFDWLSTFTQFHVEKAAELLRFGAVLETSYSLYLGKLTQLFLISLYELFLCDV